MLFISIAHAEGPIFGQGENHSITCFLPTTNEDGTPLQAQIDHIEFFASETLGGQYNSFPAPLITNQDGCLLEFNTTGMSGQYYVKAMTILDDGEYSVPSTDYAAFEVIPPTSQPSPPTSLMTQ